MGIASLVLGIIGLILSYWYFGILFCVAGAMLGIGDLLDCFSDNKYGIFGMLISIFGAIMSVYFFVSDIDSGKLSIQSSKFVKNEDAYEFENGKTSDIEIKNTEKEDIQDIVEEKQSENIPYTREENIENQEINIDEIASVDKNLFTVELTISKDYIEEEKTQREWDKEAKDIGCKSITLNPDGSVTYIMTKKQHKKMLDELRDSINDSLKQMVNSVDYPFVTDISANDDFTEFIVKTTSDEVSLFDSMSVLGFYLYGGMYSEFSGNPVENISVKYINEYTGNVIEQFNSKDVQTE